jgi:hypothetical protein
MAASASAAACSALPTLRGEAALERASSEASASLPGDEMI